MDKKIDKYSLQHQIKELLHKDNTNNTSISFEYMLDGSFSRLDIENLGGKEPVILEVITYNPIHNKSFLYHTVGGNDELDATEQMLKYVQNSVSIGREKSYTITWVDNSKKDKKHQVSYFSAKSLRGALDKLYHGRHESEIEIYEAKFNPIS